MAVNEAIKYENLTDEQIVTVKRRVETFTKSNEFFDKLCNHLKWDRGTKTMTSRRVVRPIVKESDVVPSAELVAPRPSKIVVETFKHSVEIFRDKVGYSAEDVLFGYDDIVKMAGDTLAEIFVQKLDYIKGKPFISSKCIGTFDTSYDKTLAHQAIVLKKNGAKYWNKGRYLALVTPETLEAIRSELKSAGSYISEPTKEDIDSGIIAHYARWDFMECPSDLLIKNATTQYMICLGRRPNGESPIDVARIDGVEIIHNELGSGVLVDVDGNYTSDDNKQKGSIAMNANGLGAYVNDDLCVIDVEVTVNEIGKSLLAEGDKTGFESMSHSPLGIVVSTTAGTGSTMSLSGVTDVSGTKYAAQGSLIKATVEANANKAFASGHPALADWSVTANKGAKILGVVDGGKSVIIELSQSAQAFTVSCSATAS